MLNFLGNNIKWVAVAIAATAIILYSLLAPESSVPFLEAEPLLQDDPDAFVINATYTTYAPTGELESIVHSDQAKHYPQPETGKMQNPRVELFQNGEPSWNASSKTGAFSADNDSMQLIGAVEIKGATSGGLDVRMTTEQLHYTSQAGFIHTDHPVTISSASGILQAIGMSASIEDRQVSLHSEVKGEYIGHK